jgi:hypothetical protein
MIKKTLLLLSFICNASAYAGTTDIQFSYQKEAKELTAAGTLCTYGKKSKQSLPSAVISYIHNHVKDQNKNFIEQIRAIKTGMFGRRLNTAELAIMYQLTEKHLGMDYFFEGNDACVNFHAVLELDYNRETSAYFNFDQPESWTFVGKRNNLSSINQAIKSIYPNITLTNADLSKSSLIELSKVSNTYALYKFDAQAYKADQASQLNTVFINAPDTYKAAMEEYLTSYQFSIATNTEDANWYLHITPKRTAQGLLFSISYQSKTSVNKVIKNDPTALPMLPTSNDQELQNLITLHLEMMEFVQLLESL